MNSSAHAPSGRSAAKASRPAASPLSARHRRSNSAALAGGAPPSPPRSPLPPLPSDCSALAAMPCKMVARAHQPEALIDVCRRSTQSSFVEQPIKAACCLVRTFAAAAAASSLSPTPKDHAGASPSTLTLVEKPLRPSTSCARETQRHREGERSTGASEEKRGCS